MSFDKDNKDELIREIKRLQKVIAKGKLEKLKNQTDTLSKFYKSLEKSSLLAISTDSNGIITFCNQSVCKATGYSRNELIGQNVFEILIPEDMRELYVSTHKRYIEDGEFPENLKDRVLDKSGRWIYIRYHSFILNNPLDQSSNITMVAEDVTEKDRINKALEKSNSRLQELFDNAHDLILVLSIDGNFKFTNKSWISAVGYSSDELRHSSFVELVHPDYRVHTENFLKHLGSSEKSGQLETVILSKEGNHIFLSGSINCTFENGVPAEFRIIFHDISERVRTEKVRNLYYGIANQSIHSHSFEELYGNIHSELNIFMNAENFYFAILEDDVLSIPFYIKNNLRSQYENNGFEKNVTEYALSQNRSLLITEKDFGTLFKQGLLPKMDEVPSVWLGAPLFIDQHIIGLISLYSYEHPHPFGRRELDLLDFISGQISLALNRKRNEDKITSQTARLNALFESSSHLIWSVNANFELTSFNQNYSDTVFQYFGKRPKPNQTFGKYSNLPTKSNQNEFWTEKYNSVLEGNSLHFETQHKGDFNNEIWLDIYLNPIYHTDGSIKEISGIAHDITDKKRSGLALRESEEKFRNIFESFQDLYFKCNPGGNILMVSPSVREMTGYDQFEVLEKNITNYYLYTSKTKDLIRQLVKNKTVRNFEASLVRKDGKIIQCICNVRLKIGNEGSLEIEGVVRDITRLKETNDQLIQAKELAERSLKVKEEFLANMSHEIRTPMNGIIGVLDLLGASSLEPQQIEYLATIKKSSGILMEILNDILDLSKIEAGKMKLRKSAKELRQVIGKLYAMFSQQATSRRINLAYYIHPRLPEYVMIDETRLVQIISNLISNAIKFTPDGGSIHLSMKPQFKYGKTHVIKVNVRDTGIGIAKEHLDSLFKSFSQIDDSSTKSFGGTGLGLRISKELCELMNGNIGVYSTPNLGSTFWFTFEATSTDKEMVEKEHQEDGDLELGTFNELNPRILLVDDNLVNNQVAGEILKASGCLVDMASNGFEAIEMVTKNEYDLVFMDIQMPQMDGVTATQKLKDMDLPDLPPIVAMTAYGMGPDKERFLSQGMDDYLAKPIKAQQLINKVQQWLNGTKEMQQSPDAVNDTLQVVSKEVIAQLEKYSGPEMVKEILKDFENETQDQLEQCRNSLLVKDYQSILRDLHTLKGSAGTMGVEKLAHQAKEIEINLKDNKFESISGDLSELNKLFKEFQDNYHIILNL